MIPHLLSFFQEIQNNDETGEIDIEPARAWERIDSWVDGFVKNLPNILIGIAFFVVMYFLAKWLGKFVKKQLKKRNRSNFGEILGGFVKWIMLLMGLAFALTIMMPNISPAELVGGLGVSSVAIGFAFQDILQNWLAGILILSRQPFRVGDEIEVNGFRGKVDRIETRATVITTYDGQDIVIPNNDIYTNSVRVITAHEYIRSQYDLGLGYDQPYDKAVKLLEETIRNVDGVIADKPVDILAWDQADDWLTIRMRWWTKSGRGDVVKIWHQVLRDTQHAMDKEGIDLPFPTRVIVRDAHDIPEAQKQRKEEMDLRRKSLKIDEPDGPEGETEGFDHKNDGGNPDNLEPHDKELENPRTDTISGDDD